MKITSWRTASNLKTCKQNSNAWIFWANCTRTQANVSTEKIISIKIRLSFPTWGITWYFILTQRESKSLELEILRSPSSYISFVHCFLSLAVGFIIFAISSKCKKPQKIPITIFSKIFYFKMNYDFFKLMKTPFQEREEESFEEKKEKIEKDIEDQQNTDRNDLFNRIKSFNWKSLSSLASTVEATCESGFQFYFQLSYLLPTILISVALVTGDVHDDDDLFSSQGGGGSLRDLFNWRTASIAVSFFSISRTFCTIRWSLEDILLFKFDFLFLKIETRLNGRLWTRQILWLWYSKLFQEFVRILH